ncbi:MAG: glycosyltransferase [Caulobacter sp.]|nr:glycosyltransferase [Caulobacter sp.]
MARLLLHVIPQDGLGGAEIAARRAAAAEPERLTVLALAGALAGPPLPNLQAPGALHPFSPLAAIRAGRLARDYPVAVFSLWKSALAMLACALLAPRTRRVLFLHSDRRVHLSDTLATWLGARLAHEIWADSRKTLEGLAGLAPAATPGRVISFLLERRPGRVRTAPAPRFIYWGRLNPLKRLDRVIDLFARIARDRPDARLTLIGPDAGSEASLKAQVARLGLRDQVAFTGGLDMAAITALAEDHDIFLQLSDQEGAAMSLIEAMQLGLVAVVTPVGEMPVHVTPSVSGLIYREEAQAAAEIGALLDNPPLFTAISAAAVDHWAGGRLYQDDVVAAALDLAAREV